jgi:RHS repeat-associated protein
MDNLTLSYDGFRLTNVSETIADYDVAASFEYKKAKGSQYMYDDNGSLVADKSRDIAYITYDFNSNPSAIYFTNGNVTKYVYSVTGQKLRAIYYTAMPYITRTFGKKPIELTQSQILYKDSTDYLLGGSLVMKNGRIDKCYFEGGFARAFETSETTDRFVFYYYNQDHLGNNREVVDIKGRVMQVTNYYPFGAPYADDTAMKGENLQPYKYNCKELDKMHGLNTYDYGARQYDPILARWDRMDPLAEKYYGISPYAYCANNPVNAIDKEGKLTLFINGFHNGWEGGTSTYWNGFDNAIMSHFNDRNKLYYDGSLGGIFGISNMGGNQITLNFSSTYTSNLLAYTRYEAGYSTGKQSVTSILSSLQRNKDGAITEPIRIISHSMGGAYAKGLAQALMDYIQDNPKLTNGLRIVEYDFAPFQPNQQKSVDGVTTYQYSHKRDQIAGADKIQGAFYMHTSDKKGKDHSISSFLEYVNTLPLK